MHTLWQSALEEAERAEVSTPMARLERDVFRFRSQLGLNQASTVAAAIPAAGSTPVSLQAVRWMALVQQGKLSVDEAASSAASAAATVSADEKPLAHNLLATLLVRCGKLQPAYELVRGGATMEHHALATHIELALDRIDLARDRVAAMRAADDESTLAVLAGAWVSQFLGRDAANDAAAAYRELIDKFGPSPQLRSALASACVAAGRFRDAESHLTSAPTIAATDQAAALNMITCARHAATAPGADPAASDAAAESAIDTLESAFPTSALAERSRFTRSAIDRATADA